MFVAANGHANGSVKAAGAGKRRADRALEV